MRSPMTDEQIRQLRASDTCVVANTIESSGVRLRNEGIATGAFRCLFKNLRPMVGHAARVKFVLPIRRSWAAAMWNVLTGRSTYSEFRLRPWS